MSTIEVDLYEHRDGVILRLVGSRGATVVERPIGRDRAQAKNKKLTFDEACDRALERLKILRDAADGPLEED